MDELEEQSDIEAALHQAMGRLQFANVAQSVRIQRQAQEIEELKAQLAGLDEERPPTTSAIPS